MHGGREAWWKCPLIGCFGNVASWVAHVSSRVASLHEFGEVRCEVDWFMGFGCDVGGGASRIFLER